MQATLRIANEFTRTPGSRYEREGDYSGEVFRRDFLYPRLAQVLEDGQKLLVDLDGTAGFGTSFLEEAFGGLVRNNGLTAEQLHSGLLLHSAEEPYLVDDIWSYIDQAGGAAT